MMTKEEFIQKASQIHENKYSYIHIKQDIIKSRDEVPILCEKHNFIFYQDYWRHISKKRGCSKCQPENFSLRYSHTTKSFIKKAREVHGYKYDYSKLKYVHSTLKVIIGCKRHKWFEQRANAHLRGGGCLKCAREVISWKVQKANTCTTQEFIKKSKLKWGNKYDYSRVKNYKNSDTLVIIECKKHKIFIKVTAHNHIRSGLRCPLCNKRRKNITFKMFLELARKMHDKIYIYKKDYYKGIDKKVKIKCRKKGHGYFLQNYLDHIRGKGCPICTRKTGYSRKAIEWLRKMEKHLKIKIRHMKHIGEYSIKLLNGKNIKVDGYHPRSKTVFEFHGDAYHGNPKVYKPNSKPNYYFPNKTAKRLYKETKEREKQIKRLGFNLITIWESDYNNPTNFKKWLKKVKT